MLLAQCTLMMAKAPISGRSNFNNPLPDDAPAIDRMTSIKMDWGKIGAADIQRAKQKWLGIFNP